MKKKITVSVGIPAYNEAKNIKKLLTSLLHQQERGFVLREIIVVLDGSSDGTLQQLQTITDARIVIIKGKKRKGKSARLKQIFQQFTSDVLVLLDADVIITDAHLFAKILKRSHLTRDGLVTVNALPLPAQNFFEKSLEVGVLMMKDIAHRWNGGRNYLSFKGCFLILDKTFAKRMMLPQSLVNNDAFLYFSAIEQGYPTRSLSDLFVFYRSPRTLHDHRKQAARYHASRDELVPYFSETIDQAYHLPLTISLQSMIKYFFRHPVYWISYLGIKLITKVSGERKITSTWSIAHSTK